MAHLNDDLLVITDLDGTLLDPNTHEWTPAQAWLERLIEHDVPVILSSSKTAAEIIALQAALGLEGQPFIAENGAIVQLDATWQDNPDFPRLLNGMPHDEILEIINRLRHEQGYKLFCFSDVDEKTIAEWTGLSPKLAAMATLLEASETVIWRDSDENLARFSASLEALGLMLIEGGRFWHVLDVRGGKGQAANWLKEQYRKREGKLRTTLGLGDGPDDASLLDNVDFAVVVKGLSRQGVMLKNDDPQRVYRTHASGPAGFSEGLDHFLGKV
ncbi:Putative mannosyl-3-phosphoglycerate phosphatase [Cronobacter condimenti 1330]|uniref:Mannosyl-3-phosphoglycerate phosphatase n=1 Tax=Cronobacter condimenti 1330 TaxID=1073999 RepID=K7ZZJ6_9ENTR|nr:mannosyl-3-phosphoglycerate phosphatase-related protein [Cronobacter condimenti]ALB63225.1 mannosyl-3-phosphoglycerate phosphatase [Cronobacter condimenti 1330]CCJ72141.1 Putative mannosyl-3-phosphoglycerate phosphatase [Cronobacter condimenti 1330]